MIPRIVSLLTVGIAGFVSLCEAGINATGLVGTWRATDGRFSDTVALRADHRATWNFTMDFDAADAQAASTHSALKADEWSRTGSCGRSFGVVAATVPGGRSTISRRSGSTGFGMAGLYETPPGGAAFAAAGLPVNSFCMRRNDRTT